MLTINRDLPFLFDKETSFFQGLSDYIGDVFYDLLPEAGFELRDEQIFMAFQLEQAYKQNKAIFAEAGVGTGKTLVYLLYAICYARYKGKPAIIACADENLIEQLMKPGGELDKLKKHLNIDVDARLAKSPSSYLCLKKFEKTTATDDDEAYDDIYDRLPEFVFENATMQSFKRYGDRKDFPDLSDDQWEKVNWDSLQQCSSCDVRHRCGMTLNRDYYRKATDLIICSHDFFMEHVWTKESRQEEGQLPLLPEMSSVVFDEGHLLEFAAQKALTHRLQADHFLKASEPVLENGLRESFLLLVEEVIHENNRFFKQLQLASTAVRGSERYEIEWNSTLQACGEKLISLVEKLEDELVFEGESFLIDEYHFSIFDEGLSRLARMLTLLLKEKNAVYWAEGTDTNYTLVIMPKQLPTMLKEQLFSGQRPFIFTSATMSENGSFEYLQRSLGVENPLTFSVDSPFDYEQQARFEEMKCEEDITFKSAQVIRQLEKTDGRGLILFRSKEELLAFKTSISKFDLPWNMYFEGEEEISTLTAAFESDEQSVLCAYRLWEGLDIPGPALSHVIIWSLPFPPNDPVFQSKRRDSNKPFEEIDLPYMLLRLRQGFGRLIRSSEDNGVVTLCLHNEEEQLLEQVRNVIPNNTIVI
ncbi:ATP-dependent DNA helicase [Bacillus solimangrovi]|uniref:ATP-dependent helicase n=1 Tax=Bacillus solimangrovi TaxID=1305675 RepID=A0A1E5LFY7_9BACI|nr:ATP-dependent DNA helicase [Bacillus solimangrovi]OEH92982.1 ATP-dependent helicase [Bacillus solimangrovi]